MLLGLAGLWGRLEVALSKTRDQSKLNEKEISKLERKVEDQAAATQAQAIQLGRIEESIVGIGRTLERMERKIPSN